MEFRIDKAKKLSFYMEQEAFSGVKKIAEKVINDVWLVTGIEAELIMGEEIPDADERRQVVYIGTLGRGDIASKVNNGMTKTEESTAPGAESKNPAYGISGKREVYSFEVADNKLIIVGSDKRGTIYGLFHLSELLGVSPWVYFADVMPEKKDSLVLTEKDSTVSKEPSVKYRGFFINDEWPSFGNWTFSHFGGFNSKMYDHLFELILRLKGNYLWPAMWSSSFSLDGPGLDNALLADEYGIVMSNSHHEPCLRHSEEWDKVRGVDTPYGNEWNFDRNREGLLNYWRDGLLRNGSFENIITIGMRGERDSTVLGAEATLQDNINYLKDVITAQNKLIKETVGNDLAQIPRMLAIYKEVEKYFYGDGNTKGLRDWEELDGVTLMLCEDNFGNMRSLPEAFERNRKGGWGMYYHFDYHGDPVSYEWVNSTNLPKVWEQMTTAYEHGIRDIWVVNVGDLKSQELPLSYFMDLAYDYDKWGISAVNATEKYTREWIKAQFGHSGLTEEELEEVFGLIQDYTYINCLRKPEALQTDTYHPVHYGESDKMLAFSDSVIKRAGKMLDRVLELTRGVENEFYAAFVELVFFPAAASANVLKMQLSGGKNKVYAMQGRISANTYAEMIKECIDFDRELRKMYHEVLDGKWNGMMLSEHIGFKHWNDEECAYPVRSMVEPANKPRMIVAASSSTESTQGGAWTGKEIVVDDFVRFDTDCCSIDIANGSTVPFDFEIEYDSRENAPYEWLSVSDMSGKVEDTARVTFTIDRSKVKGAQEARLFVKSRFSRVAVRIPVSDQSAGQFDIAADAFEKNNTAEEGSFICLVPYGKYKTAVKAFPVNKRFEDMKYAPSLEYGFEVSEDGEIEITILSAPSNPSGRDGMLRFGTALNGEEPELINTVSTGYRGGESGCREWAAGVLDNIHAVSFTKKAHKGKNKLTIYACDPGFVLERILIRKKTDRFAWKPGYLYTIKML